MVGSDDVSRQQFDALFGDLSSWGKWGRDDERGALHLLTPARVAAAVRLVHDGVTVTLSLPLNTHAGAHNPKPADHHMTALGSEAPDSDSVHFSKDYVGADYHNDGHTHIDALCHVAYEGKLYNGRPEDAVTPQGAPVEPIRKQAEQQAQPDGSQRASGGALSLAQLLQNDPRARGDPEEEPAAPRT